MAKAKKVSSKPAEETVGVAPAGVEPMPTEVVKSKGVKFPEVVGTGKFQAVEVEGGFAVYNGGGQRVSQVLTDAQAKDFVLRNNAAR
jgi:hypothetical protein